MSNMPLTDAIEALTRYANEITGQTDADLSAAVATLAAGYGAGADILDAGKPDGDVVSAVSTTKDGICMNRTGITSVSAPNLTAVPAQCFQSCTALASVNLPAAVSIGKSAFQGCSALTVFETEANLAFRSDVPFQFSSCTSLTEFTAPNATGTVGQEAFSSCTSLAEVDLGSITSLNKYRVFGSCAALGTLILRNNAVVQISNSTFYGCTKIEDGGSGAVIYVPSALIEDYKIASIWSTYFGYGTLTFTAIEGSEYEI